MMNRKIIALLSALLLTLFVTGCDDASGTKDGNENTMLGSVESEEKKETTASAPDFSRIEPIAIPESGWDEKSIKSVIYINGKNIDFPFTFADLGDGFATDPNYEPYVNEENNTVRYDLDYYGEHVGGVWLTDYDKFDDPYSGVISEIKFIISEDYLPNKNANYPININGITIGSSYDDMVNKLGFVPDNPKLKPDNNDDGGFGLTEHIGDIAIKIAGIDNMVTSITIYNGG